MPDRDAVAIIGLGLMGGSLARALRAVAPGLRIIGVDQDAAARTAARAAGAVAVAAREIGAAAGAGTVVLATPVFTACALLRDHGPAWRQATLITDVCSVKVGMHETAAAAGLADRFVGAHPLCGSHAHSFAAARADLYHEAPVWLVPASAHAPLALAHALWRSVGAVPRVTDAADHDRLLAWISHLPQGVASALGAALARSDHPAHELGPGGRDATRLAASAPDIWIDILLANRTQLLPALLAMTATLDEMVAAIEASDVAALRRLLATARDWRTSDT